MIDIQDKTKCCACGACIAVCPKDAIHFETDEFGNRYPKVLTDKCIQCGLCNKTCPLENEKEFKRNLETYAAVYKDKALLNSASGGAFYGLAKSFLEKTGGIVYGCMYAQDMTPVIRGVFKTEDLCLLQGSKYAMSVITKEVFKEIKSYLKDGKKVLFSGVPCQCSAIRHYCKNLDNLYTIELLCHGFVDQDYWKDYVSLLQKKHKTNLVDFAFRNKDKGNFVARYVARYVAPNGNIKDKRFYANPSTSYYYHYFLSGKIYRENCYQCKFAQMQRVSDVTIGDYWGYHGNLDGSKGISAIMIQTDKGKELLALTEDSFALDKSTIEDVAKNNGQLNAPISPEIKQYDILKEWKEKGAKFQDDLHRKNHFKAYLASKLNWFR